MFPKYDVSFRDGVQRDDATMRPAVDPQPPVSSSHMLHTLSPFGGFGPMQLEKSAVNENPALMTSTRVRVRVASAHDTPLSRQQQQQPPHLFRSRDFSSFNRFPLIFFSNSTPQSPLL